MSEAGSTSLAERCWRVFEPIHDVTYFAEESRAAGEAIGLKGWWMSYFAFRAAPLGAVPAEVVRAAFYNFHRSRVERAIPDAWALASLDTLLEARGGAVGAVLRRVLGGDEAASTAAQAALPLAREAAAACDCSGRVLAAGNRVLRLPDDPVVALWQALTVLREHRGDGHVACLVEAGVDSCEALVLHAACGIVPAEVLRTSRNWPEDEWAAAEERLASRGLVVDGSATAAGRELRSAIEDATNRLAAGPLAALGSARAEQLIEHLQPIAKAVVASGMLPSVLPVGLDLSAS